MGLRRFKGSSKFAWRDSTNLEGYEPWCQGHNSKYCGKHIKDISLEACAYICGNKCGIPAKGKWAADICGSSSNMTMLCQFK